MNNESTTHRFTHNEFVPDDLELLGSATIVLCIIAFLNNCVLESCAALPVRSPDGRLQPSVTHFSPTSHLLLTFCSDLSEGQVSLTVILHRWRRVWDLFNGHFFLLLLFLFFFLLSSSVSRHRTKSYRNLFEAIRTFRRRRNHLSLARSAISS